MLNISYTNSEISRQQVIDFLLDQKKKDPNYKVIDVGGAATSWTSSVADFVVDINTKDSDRSISADICTTQGWNKVLDLAQKLGGFSYAHTLEDLYNPFLSIENLPKIASSGIITMPSIEAELSNIESLNWKGNIHHRWIFDQEDEKILIIPKIGAIESLVEYTIYKKETSEIRFDWEQSIEYKVFMNNYLGPNVRTVTAAYRDLLQKSLERQQSSFKINDLNSKVGRNAYKIFKKLTILRKMVSK